VQVYLPEAQSPSSRRCIRRRAAAGSSPGCPGGTRHYRIVERRPARTLLAAARGARVPRSSPPADRGPRNALVDNPPRREPHVLAEAATGAVFPASRYRSAPPDRGRLPTYDFEFEGDDRSPRRPRGAFETKLATHRRRRAVRAREIPATEEIQGSAPRGQENVEMIEDLIREQGCGDGLA